MTENAINVSPCKLVHTEVYDSASQRGEKIMARDKNRTRCKDHMCHTIGHKEESMAKLLKPRDEVKQAIAARIRAGNDLAAKAEIAEQSGRYEDWLYIFAKWREETATELTALYEERDRARIHRCHRDGRALIPALHFSTQEESTRNGALLVGVSN